MSIFSLFFALGVLVVGLSPRLLALSDLPHYAYLLLPFGVALLWLWWFGRRCDRPWVRGSTALLWGLSLGLIWGNYAGWQTLTHQLEPDHEGRDLVVTGQLVALPQRDPERLRFTLELTKLATTAGLDLPAGHLPKRIQLSWYAQGRYNPNQIAAQLPELRPGQRWQLQVRLKRPRGLANPAGFDYQAWLLRKGIGATGYVRSSRFNQCLNCAPEAAHHWLGLRAQVDLWRYELQQWLLRSSSSSEKGILVALLIGEASELNKDQWLRMQQTGTSHLIAISGLHVGFLAIFGYALGMLLGRCIQPLWRVYPAQHWAYLGAIVFALGYSALAGFNIPTLRTFLMLALFYSLALWWRQGRILAIYCVALAVVVLLDPLAGFDMGFWLSFGAVGLLLLYFTGRYQAKARATGFSRLALGAILVGFGRSQWVMFIGLLVPLSFFIHSISLSAPLANFIAIPLVTFVVVPALLLAAALQSLWPWASGGLLVVAEQGLALLKVWLEWLQALAPGQLNPVLNFSPSVATLMLLSALLLLLPRGLGARYLGFAGLLLGIGLSLCGPATQAPLKLRVLDVGQGTAVVVQTPEGILVYDTGPRYSRNFEAGGAILVPYLFAEGITRIDKLVLSHMDRDHIGGLEGLLARVAVTELLIGEAPRRAAGDYFDRAQNCHAYPAWRWGMVSFEFLQWDIHPGANANNHSCVLLIRYGDQAILLPGDAEQEVEWQLLRNPALPKNLSLLLVGHHGSRTSSSSAFVQATRPRQVVYSAGFANQHGHPHPVVQARFNAIGAKAWNTATSGALLFEWAEGSDVRVTAQRERHRRYWFERN